MKWGICVAGEECSRGVQVNESLSEEKRGESEEQEGKRPS